jgi:hypothetical protein
MKERILRGKYLVRKSTLGDGKQVLTLTGVFHPMNFDINEVNSDDEMWVSDIIVSDGGIRFSDPFELDGGSPEDFLAGRMQSPSDWKTKGKII